MAAPLPARRVGRAGELSGPEAQTAGGVSVLAGQSGGLGGRIESDGNTVFRGTSSICAEGGNSVLAGSEGVMSFRGDATFMGSAYLGAGNVAGANGGRIDFFDRASHDTTRFAPGAGNLGIYNVGVVVSGARAGDGVNADSGELVVASTSGSATGSGEVRIERGGKLGGSGFIAGPVTLRNGGTLAPGDPVTLTLQSSLTWDGGGLIRLVLGADDAGSDHIIVQSLVRGASGPFVFELIDAGIVGGASYTLLQVNSLVGFVASDFTFSGAGAAGNFSIVNGAIGFTAAVPEPSSTALLVLGLHSIAWCVRRISRATRA